MHSTGPNKSLRAMPGRREQPHVLAVRSNERFMAGSFQTRAAAGIADAVPAGGWQRLAAGEGAKRPRFYDWALVRLFRLQELGRPFDHWLLARRSLRDPYEVELAGVVGLRWMIETCFETAKDDLGLNHCEAQPWHAWHRHMTLVMAALAFLAKLRADLLRSSISGNVRASTAGPPDKRALSRDAQRPARDRVCGRRMVPGSDIASAGLRGAGVEAPS